MPKVTVVVPLLVAKVGAGAAAGAVVTFHTSPAREVSGNALWYWSWNWLTVNWAEVPLTTVLPPTGLTAKYAGWATTRIVVAAVACVPLLFAETAMPYEPPLLKATVAVLASVENDGAAPLGFELADQVKEGWVARPLPNWSRATAVSDWFVPVRFSVVLGLTRTQVAPE